VFCDRIIRHAPEPAQHEDVAQLLRHADDNLLQDDRFELTRLVSPFPTDKIEPVDFRATKVAAIAVEEEVSGGLEKEGLWLPVLDRGLLPQRRR